MAAAGNGAEAREPMIGVIGGSGLYDMAGLTDKQWVQVATPWGAPSDQILTGRIGATKVAFLPRHGRGHRIPPSEINYRANIDAMKRIGCTDLLSMSAVGSFKEDLPPGTFVIADQFIDRTFARMKSFFGTGMVAHVAFGHPVCARLGDHLEAAAAAAKIPHKRGGTYLCMEGPQFSTQAESFLYKGWGCHVVGMTNMPEAKLAREAELCYATVAMVTDFDCWHPDHDHVEVSAIVKVLLDNAAKAQDVVRGVVPAIAGARPAACPQGCDHALENALITAPEARDPTLLARLDVVAGRLLKA